jgi:hypothetical protein
MKFVHYIAATTFTKITAGTGCKIMRRARPVAKPSLMTHREVVRMLQMMTKTQTMTQRGTIWSGPSLSRSAI